MECACKTGSGCQSWPDSCLIPAAQEADRGSGLSRGCSCRSCTCTTHSFGSSGAPRQGAARDLQAAGHPQIGPAACRWAVYGHGDTLAKGRCSSHLAVDRWARAPRLERGHNTLAAGRHNIPEARLAYSHSVRLGVVVCVDRGSPNNGRFCPAARGSIPAVASSAGTRGAHPSAATHVNGIHRQAPSVHSVPARWLIVHRTEGAMAQRSCLEAYPKLCLFLLGATALHVRRPVA
mmetsp:Transcript_79812/g.222181  ORF Transcript_79812/g.222181 Transcript_79812/m.222181 type:complete len:234 (-) Transcript_79812:2101-2802(-)